MSEKKIAAPEGMLEAAATEARNLGSGWVQILEAALRWLSENPIEPTPQWIHEVWRQERNPQAGTFALRVIREWQRRMFLAPESEVPEEIKDLAVSDLDMEWDGPINKRILEAFRRGQKSK